MTNTKQDVEGLSFILYHTTRVKLYMGQKCGPFFTTDMSVWAKRIQAQLKKLGKPMSWAIIIKLNKAHNTVGLVCFMPTNQKNQKQQDSAPSSEIPEFEFKITETRKIRNVRKPKYFTSILFFSKTMKILCIQIGPYFVCPNVSNDILPPQKTIMACTFLSSPCRLLNCSLA